MIPCAASKDGCFHLYLGMFVAIAREERLSAIGADIGGLLHQRPEHDSCHISTDSLEPGAAQVRSDSTKRPKPGASYQPSGSRIRLESSALCFRRLPSITLSSVLAQQPATYDGKKVSAVDKFISAIGDLNNPVHLDVQVKSTLNPRPICSAISYASLPVNKQKSS